MHLRTLIRALATLAIAISLASAAALAVISGYLHTITLQLANNLESVRAAEEIELQLLRHARHSQLAMLGGADARAIHDHAAHDASAHIREWYFKAEQFVGSPQEQDSVSRLGAKIEAYFAEHAQLNAQGVSGLDLYVALEAPLESVYDEAEELLQINLVQAADAARQAQQWDSIANWMATITALLLVATMLAVISGAGVMIYRPLLALRDAIARFSSGDYSARVTPAGALEIREISDTFNEMAGTLARHRQSQLSFIAGVAHDLRNPLSALKMAIATIMQPNVTLPEGHLQRTLELVDRQVDVLTHLTSDLLEAARVESGHFAITPLACDARDFAAHVAELFRTASPRHKVTVDLPEGAVPVRCDPVRIEQVMNNLVSNAIKYSPSGGEVRIAVSADAKDVRVAVSDEGLGIPAGEHERIFEPFRRGEISREAIPGIGLGLSVARRIIEAHGGSITLVSRPGAGSTFTVRIPRQPITP